MKLSCYVVDDEPLAVELMDGYVRKTPFLESKGSFYSASAAFEALKQEAVDLLFCDIQMPEPVLTLMSMKVLEEQLPADRFIRVHRSYIIQPSKMSYIERGRVVFGKVRIPVSDTYRQGLHDFLGRHSVFL